MGFNSGFKGLTEPRRLNTSRLNTILRQFCQHHVLTLILQSVSSTTSVAFDVHESVHRDIIMKVTNKMQLYRLIYYS